MKRFKVPLSYLCIALLGLMSGIGITRWQLNTKLAGAINKQSHYRNISMNCAQLVISWTNQHATCMSAYQELSGCYNQGSQCNQIESAMKLDRLNQRRLELEADIDRLNHELDQLLLIHPD